MTRQQQNVGKHGEDLAESVLNGLGLLMLEKIGTPMKLIPVQHFKKNVYQVIFGEKVSGDRRAIMPSGQSVLIETKTILDRNLRYSDLRDHQPGRLSEHDENNGLSLLVWVHNSGVYVMEWPIVGFKPGTGLTPQIAAIWDETTRVNIIFRVKHPE